MTIKSIGQIKEEFVSAGEAQLPSLIGLYQADHRAGVQALIQKAK